jgi:hypothetical protein
MKKQKNALVSRSDWLVEQIVEMSLSWKRVAHRKNHEARAKEDFAIRRLAKCYSDCADQLQKAVRTYLKQDLFIYRIAVQPSIKKKHKGHKDLARTHLPNRHKRKDGEGGT